MKIFLLRHYNRPFFLRRVNTEKIGRLLVSPVSFFIIATLTVFSIAPQYGYNKPIFLVIFTGLSFLFISYIKEGFFVLFFLRFTLDMMWNVKIAPELGVRNPLYVVGIFVPLLCTVYLALKKPNFLILPGSKLTLLYFFVLLLSFVASPITRIGLSRTNILILNLENLLRFTSFIPIFFLIPFLFNARKDISKFLNTWLLGSVIPVVVTLFLAATEAKGAISNKWGFSRFYGPFYDPANLGIIAFVTIVIIVFKLIAEKKQLRKNISLYLWALIVMYIFYQSMSRTTWIGFAVTILVWLMFNKRWRLLAVFVALVVLLYNTLPGIRLGFQQEIRALAGEGNILHIGDMRPRTWYDYIHVFKNYKPFQKVLGAGPAIPLNPHNQFLYYLLAAGILGLISYFALVGGIGIALLKRFIDEKEFYFSQLIALTVGLWVANFVMGLSFQPMAWVNFQWFLWSLVGICLIRNNQLSNTAIQPNNSITCT